jgi:hypothetical protein
MNEPDDQTTTELKELTGTEGGVWHVLTRDSVHVFDLDAMTVTRNPGPGAAPGWKCVAQPLRSIVTCTVGERGYWTMHTEAWSATIDFYWHSSSVVRRIERADEPGQE